MACQVYLLAMQILPAFVRSWYSELDKSLASSVDQFTAKYVSPILCEEEIQAVQGAEKSFVNMTVSHQSYHLLCMYPRIHTPFCIKR